MNFILDEEHEYYTRKRNDNEYDDNYCVFSTVDGHDEVIDDRGELFDALMQVAKCMFPNV
jgi:hypothetical protein